MGRRDGWVPIVVALALWMGFSPALTRAQDAGSGSDVPRGRRGGGIIPDRMMIVPGSVVPQQPSQEIVDAAIISQRDGSTSIPPLQSGVVRGASASDVAINWENVTLKDCIEVLCRDLGMEFIISPSVNVSQEVSIRAGDVTAWERADKLEMFDAVLETAGVQRIARGRVWVFSPSDIRPVVRAFEGSELADGKPVIGVIELKNIDASAAQNFLNNVGGKPDRIYGMSGSHLLVVMGTQAYLKQMEELLKVIDVPPSVLVHYVLKTADANDVAAELSSIFYRRQGGDGTAVQFFAIARLNMVVAHNTPPALVPEVQRWIEMLDHSDGLNERVTKIYRLKVVDAETIGKTLDQLYSDLYAQSQSREKELGKTATKTAQANAKNNSKNTTRNKPPTTNTGNKNAATAKAAPAPSAPAPSAPTSGGDVPSPSGTVDEEVIVLSDKDTNTLIVNAPADMHKEIAKTIEELDRSRRQVLIETVLVEVTLDESLDLGVEWAVLGKGNPASSGALISGGIGLDSLTTGGNPLTKATDGLTYLLTSSDQKMALIHAAQDDDRLQVLSSPTVLTRDGMEAEVSFGEEVPIQQSSVTDAGKENFSYDYRDAKITLKVTPHIDDYRMVTLDLEQTLRAVNPETVNDKAPKFYTRELRSNLQVYDGQTLILGGLIQRNDQKVRTGIPFLSKIPLLGWVFGRTKTVKVGSEILMILTPHVVDSRDETDLLTREFQHKILGAMRRADIRELYNLAENEPPVKIVPQKAEKE